MGGRADFAAEHGSAMLIALVVAMLLSALGLGLVTMSSTEQAIAGNFQAVHHGRLAAEAALERALVDVRRFEPSDILSGAAQSSFRDSSLTPVAPWGISLDLISMTAAIQAQSDSAFGWSANNSRWRLLLYGPLTQLVPVGDSPIYVAAWIGDDVSETDGNPLADTNRILVILARAMGPAGLTSTLRAAVSVEEGVRILSWRELK
jgi:hypothetical protein